MTVRLNFKISCRRNSIETIQELLIIKSQIAGQYRINITKLSLLYLYNASNLANLSSLEVKELLSSINSLATKLETTFLVEAAVIIKVILHRKTGVIPQISD